MFAPSFGIPEDPAMGTAVFLMLHGIVGHNTCFTCEQGTKMGRRIILHVRTGSDIAAAIEVGGCVAPLVEVVMTL
jgi:predicted PhzF superfamily epimerase YddE/YHI9